MFIVYALYSKNYDKIYIGFSSNLEARLRLHNEIATKGFTVKYRPWVIIYSEEHTTKTEAMVREKQLKTAQGRKFIRALIPSIH
jgi:putative endonuclease